jgi:hypothetical protein
MNKYYNIDNDNEIITVFMYFFLTFLKEKKIRYASYISHLYSLYCIVKQYVVSIIGTTFQGICLFLFFFII